jgi:hypothetical protein
MASQQTSTEPVITDVALRGNLELCIEFDILRVLTPYMADMHFYTS